MELYIITGASRGLGAALAEALIAPDHHLICLARGSLDALRARAAAQGCVVDTLNIDLRDAVAAAHTLEQALSGMVLSRYTLACLINNAGVVEPVGRAERLTAEDIAAAITVNLTAPMALGSAFLRVTADAACVRKLVNITSGAATTPYQAWSAYCAGKAGLDQYSRCVALEQQACDNGARVVAVAPGVVDTDMQQLIRDLPSDTFPQQPRFVELHQSGQLSTATGTAARIITFLKSDDFGKQPVVDIRNLHLD